MFFKYPGDFPHVDYKPGEKAEYVWGEGMLLVRVLVNWELHGSTHDCEQISLLLNGEIDRDIGSETMRLKKSDAFYVPAGVSHIITKVISKPVEIVDIWPVTGPELPD